MYGLHCAPEGRPEDGELSLYGGNTAVPVTELQTVGNGALSALPGVGQHFLAYCTSPTNLASMRR
jgi:hypothetical protein